MSIKGERLQALYDRVLHRTESRRVAGDQAAVEPNPLSTHFNMHSNRDIDGVGRVRETLDEHAVKRLRQQAEQLAYT